MRGIDDPHPAKPHRSFCHPASLHFLTLSEGVGLERRVAWPVESHQSWLRFASNRRGLSQVLYTTKRKFSPCRGSCKSLSWTTHVSHVVFSASKFACTEEGAC